jgi:hypothetical protein
MKKISLRMVLVSVLFATSACSIFPTGSESQIEEPLVFEDTVEKTASFMLVNDQDGISVGDRVAIDLKVNTGNENMVAGKLVLLFDPSNISLDPKDIVTQNSDFSFWVNKTINEDQIVLEFGESAPGIADDYAHIATLFVSPLVAGKTMLAIDPQQSMVNNLKNENILDTTSIKDMYIIAFE